MTITFHHVYIISSIFFQMIARIILYKTVYFDLVLCIYLVRITSIYKEGSKLSTHPLLLIECLHSFVDQSRQLFHRNIDLLCNYQTMVLLPTKFTLWEEYKLISLFWCTQKVSTPLESVSVSVRPAAYTITLHNYIRMCWKSVHGIVSPILIIITMEIGFLPSNGPFYCYKTIYLGNLKAASHLRHI